MELKNLNNCIMSITHITPLNDLKEHEHEGSTCHCNPSVEIIKDTGDLLVIHNSYDGREVVEQAKDIIYNNGFKMKLHAADLPPLIDENPLTRVRDNFEDMPPVSYEVLLGDLYQITPSGLGGLNYIFLKAVDKPDCENTDIDGNPL